MTRDLRARERTESLRTISLRKTTTRISPSRISRRITTIRISLRTSRKMLLNRNLPSRKNLFRQEQRAKRDTLTQEAAT